jgi:hypothetical protein
MAIDPAPGTDALSASATGSEATVSTAAASEGPGRRRSRGNRGSAGTETEVTSPAATDPAPAAPAGEAAASEPSAPASPGRRSKRIKARQVQRVVTRIDPWSMLKVSLLFALSMWLIVVVAGVLLWRVAVGTGTIGNFENFLAQTLGEDSFTINGSQIFQGSLVVGLVFFVTGAVFAVVTSVLFNLIAGVVGGVRTTVIELETARPAAAEPPSAP